MQSVLAISLLAFCATQGVVAAPTAQWSEDAQAYVQTDSKFALVETAEDYEASKVSPAAPTITTLEEAYRTTLQEEENSDPLPPDAEPLGLFMPPPIFDPAEPRPQGIFVTEDGEVRDSLMKPPSISFTRPERLSAFDAGNQPIKTPFPPDYEELEHDPSFYPCPMWQTLFKLSAAMVVLLVAATAVTLLAERMLTSLFRRVSARRTSQPSGILGAESFLDEKHRRSRSDSNRSSVWSRSPSPAKISLA